MEFEINNQQILVVNQKDGFDSAVIVETLDNKDMTLNEYAIEPSDFIQMLNWYRYQKSIGNDDLDF